MLFECMSDKNSILEKYMGWVLENSTEPASVYAFCKKHKWKEEDFFAHFSSFEAVKAWFWESVFQNTREMLENDEEFRSYGFSEKLSAFYFLWTQQLLRNRSYVLTFVNEHIHAVSPVHPSLKSFRRSFLAFADKMVKQGVEKGEVADRKIITGQFGKAIWLQTLFLLNFWIKDDSQQFEATDAAIEKSVALVTKLLGDNLFDQAFDFGKFLFQNMQRNN